MFDELLANMSFGDLVTAHGKEWQKIRQMSPKCGRDENDKSIILGAYWLAIEKDTQLPAPVSIIFVDKD